MNVPAKYYICLIHKNQISSVSNALFSNDEFLKKWIISQTKIVSVPPPTHTHTLTDKQTVDFALYSNHYFLTLICSKEREEKWRNKMKQNTWCMVHGSTFKRKIEIHFIYSKNGEIRKRQFLLFQRHLSQRHQAISVSKLQRAIPCSMLTIQSL